VNDTDAECVARASELETDLKNLAGDVAACPTSFQNVTSCVELLSALDINCNGLNTCYAENGVSLFGATDSCFGAETSMACRANSNVDGQVAFDSCFRGANAGGQVVHMTELMAGDMVVSLDAAGAPTLERVIVTQHKAAPHMAKLLKLETASGGTVTVTPDHVIAVGGIFIPAAEAAVGDLLSAGPITKISETVGAIINPVTTSGTILTADKDARTVPVLVATHPDWIASFMLNAPTFPFVATHLLSRVAPEVVQKAYESLETTLANALPSMQTASASLPNALITAVVLGADGIFALIALMHMIAFPIGIVGVAAVTISRK